VRDAVRIVGEIVTTTGKYAHGSAFLFSFFMRLHFIAVVVVKPTVLCCECRYDIAFSNIYTLDAKGRRAVLAETAGDLTKGSLLCPELVTLSRDLSS
jgi:hypothetical protein